MEKLIEVAGSFRKTCPKDFLSKLMPILSDVGITRVANVTGLDNIGIPVYQAIRPNAKHLSVSQGKGINDAEAQVSSIIESLELFHLENIPNSTVNGNYNKLKDNHNLISPTLLNKGIIHEKSINNISFSWVEAKNIFTSELILIPKTLINMDSTIIDEQRKYFRISTNGIAGGTSFDDALIHALLELVERDVINNQLIAPNQKEITKQININSLSDIRLLQELINKIFSANLTINLFYIQNKYNLPVCICELLEQENVRHKRIIGACYGQACHLTIDNAVIKSILEAIQTRLTLITGSRDDIFENYYKKRIIGKSLFQEKAALINMDALNTKNFNNLIDAKNYILNALVANNISDVIYIDHTKENINIPIVQVISPTLELSL